MNEQFSMLYSLLFISAILGSFFALNEAVKRWKSYELFLVDSNELLSALELANYFDSYYASLNYSKIINVTVTEDLIILERDDFLKISNNSNNLLNTNMSKSSYIIIKEGGLGLV